MNIPFVVGVVVVVVGEMITTQRTRTQSKIDHWMVMMMMMMLLIVTLCQPSYSQHPRGCGGGGGGDYAWWKALSCYSS